MKSWVLSIAIVSVLITIFSLIFPNGKTSKYIIGISSFLLVFVVISPLANLKSVSFNTNDFNVNEEITYQEDFLYIFAERKVKNNENLCVKILNNYGIFCEKVLIEFDYLGQGEINIKKIKIYLQNGDNCMDNEHINNIELAIESISQCLLVNKEVVFVC